jgi:hypothetical protein
VPRSGGRGAFAVDAVSAGAPAASAASAGQNSTASIIVMLATAPKIEH